MPELLQKWFRKIGLRKPSVPFRPQLLEPFGYDPIKEDWRFFLDKLWTKGSSTMRINDALVARGSKVLFARRQFIGKPNNLRGITISADVKGGKHYAYYSNPKEFDIFFETGAYVTPRGPSEWVPGAVGSVYVNTLRDGWQIEYLQSHFRTGRPVTLTRKIATAHAGWRLALLNLVFLDAKNAHVKNIIFEWPKTSTRSHQSLQDMLALFKRAAAANEYVVEHGFGWLRFVMKDLSATKPFE